MSKNDMTDAEIRAELTDEEWEEYTNVNDLIDSDPDETGWKIISQTFESLALCCREKREMRETLKCLEWQLEVGFEGDGLTLKRQYSCPYCDLLQSQGHAPDCALARLIGGSE